MKRIINIIMVLCLVVSMAVSVSATEFVPSIEIKDAPELVPVGEQDGEAVFGYVTDKDGNKIYTVVAGDILITPISEVDTSKYISKEAADLLKETYAELLKSPNRFGHDKVVRELVDISTSAKLAEALEGEGTTLTLTFDLHLDKGAKIWIQALLDGRWETVEVVNNGDGTVTATFEAFCPVVFLVEGDGFCIVCFWLWCLVILLCLIILIMLIVWAVRRDKKEEEKKSGDAGAAGETDTTT